MVLWQIIPGWALPHTGAVLQPVERRRFPRWERLFTSGKQEAQSVVFWDSLRKMTSERPRSSGPLLRRAHLSARCRRWWGANAASVFGGVHNNEFRFKPPWLDESGGRGGDWQDLRGDDTFLWDSPACPCYPTCTRIVLFLPDIFFTSFYPFANLWQADMY